MRVRVRVRFRFRFRFRFRVRVRVRDARAARPVAQLQRAPGEAVEHEAAVLLARGRLLRGVDVTAARAVQEVDELGLAITRREQASGCTLNRRVWACVYAWCVHGVCMVCVCHLPDHIPCRRPQPVFRGRPPRRQFAALAYRLRSPSSAAPMAHESIEGERVPTEMCDHSHQKPRRIVGQHEQARTPGPRSGGASAAWDERRRTSSVVPDASRACGARSRARPREIYCVPSSLAAEGLQLPMHI